MNYKKCYYCEQLYPEEELEYFSIGKLVCKGCIAKGRLRD